MRSIARGKSDRDLRRHRGSVEIWSLVLACAVHFGVLGYRFQIGPGCLWAREILGNTPSVKAEKTLPLLKIRSAEVID